MGSKGKLAAAKILVEVEVVVIIVLIVIGEVIFREIVEYVLFTVLILLLVAVELDVCFLGVNAIVTDADDTEFVILFLTWFGTDVNEVDFNDVILIGFALVFEFDIRSFIVVFEILLFIEVAVEMFFVIEFTLLVLKINSTIVLVLDSNALSTETV